MLHLKEFTWGYDKVKLNLLQQSLQDLQKQPVNKFILTLDAHASATIEGAKTTVSAVQEAIATDKYTKDTLMCANAFKALYKLQDITLLDKSNIIDIWNVLVNGCCENTSAGTTGYRTGMVYVGSPDKIIHTPAKPEEIEPLMEELFAFNTGNNILDSILLHFYLVYVHPFCDGNGRLARALAVWKLGNYNLPVSKSINLNLRGYYKAISRSEEYHDITPFMDYMMSIYENAIYLYSLYNNELTEAESLLLSKLDRKGKGIISVSKASKILNTDADNTVHILRSLEGKNYLEYTSDGWHLLWR